MDDMLDKYRGSLVGGAVGDALGYAVEFCSERQPMLPPGLQTIRM